jgi:phospholipid/cholesterol/gamma-HCH transport system ATP-binding protein
VSLAAPTISPPSAEAHLAARRLTMAFGSLVVMRDLDLEIRQGEIFIVMGGSGCGKTTLMRHLIGLHEPAAGEVFYRQESFTRAEPERRQEILRRYGVMFQGGALFSSMTLAENVALPLGEYTDLRASEMRELACLKLALVGLRGFEDYPPPRSAVACRSGPASRAPWRSIRRFSSSTSPRPASTRSARAASTT